MAPPHLSDFENAMQQINRLKKAHDKLMSTFHTLVNGLNCEDSGEAWSRELCKQASITFSSACDASVNALRAWIALEANVAKKVDELSRPDGIVAKAYQDLRSPPLLARLRATFDCKSKALASERAFQVHLPALRAVMLQLDGLKNERFKYRDTVSIIYQAGRLHSAVNLYLSALQIDYPGERTTLDPLPPAAYAGQRNQTSATTSVRERGSSAPPTTALSSHGEKQQYRALAKDDQGEF